MNVNKWKRLLSVMLTLCMALSWNVPTYAAEDARATQCPDGQHEFTVAITDDEYYVAPTCTTDGFAKFECAKCGYFDFAQDDCFQTLPALGHKLEEVIDTPATCSAPGEKHVECTREGCGYREDSVEIPANGEHNFADAEEKVADATCTEPAKYGRPCQNEGCDEVEDLRDSTDPDEAATGHDFENSTEYKVTTPATCTATGLEAKKCANPGCEEVDETQTQVVAIDATNHGNHGTTEEATPSVAATCNSYAKYATTCDGCGAKVSEREDEAGGYDENNHPNLSSVELQTKEATCEEGGYQYQICPDCQVEVVKEGTETQPDATKHVFPSTGDKVHVSDATCHTPAKKGYVCSNCGAPDPSSLENEDPNGALDSTNHEFGAETIVDATCTENAKLVKQCQYCDPKTDPTAYIVVKDLWTEVAEADRNPEHQAGHKWVDVAKVEPTCGAPGREAGQQCSVCKEWKDGEPDEISADTSKHVFGDTPETVTRAASCAKAGLGKFKCTVCGKLAYQTLPAGHKYPEEGNVLVQATCLRPGTVEFTCERYSEDPEQNKCDLDDADRVKTETVAQKEHDMQASTDAADGYKAATCAEGGVDVQKCATCGLIETTETEATGNHNPQPNTVIPSTGCGVRPQIGTVCTVCHQFVGDGDSDVQDMTDEQIAADNTVTYNPTHTMVADPDNSVAATCTTPGVEAKKCSNTGCTHTEETDIPAAHTFQKKNDGSDAVDYTAHQPNCLQAGYYTAYCTVCEQDITLTAEEETEAGLTPLTAKTEHDNIVDMKATDATCKKDGNTAGTKCDTCGTIITGSVIPASDELHVIDKEDPNSYEVVRAANCETGATGMSKQTCTVCKNVSYVPIQPEHTWDPDTRTTVTAADCVNGGQDSVTCSVCGAEDIIDTEATGHDWDEGSDQIADGGKPASCGVAGVKVFTCQNEDCPVGTKTEPITALEHNWGSGTEITAATCGKAGEKEYTCSNCQEKKTEIIPKSDTHGSPAFGFIEANCQHGTQIGLYCQTCGQSVEKDGQPLVMNFTSATTVEEVKAFYSTNATDSGYDDSVTDSDIESAFANWAAAEATDHTWIETVTQEPACLAAGTKDRVCAVCDTAEKNIAIPAKGHDLQEDEKNSVEPSCSNGGIGKIAYTCSRCDHTEVEDVNVGEIPHVEDEEVIKAATCTANGLVKYTCSECGNVRTEIVPAGHKWDEGTYTGSYQGVDAKEPTCTEGGKKLFTCQACDAQELRDVDSLGHTWSVVKIIDKTCVDYAKVGKECATCGAASDDSVEITADSNVDELINLLKTGMDNPNDATAVGNLRTQLNGIVAAPDPEGHSYGTDDNPTVTPDADSTEATCTKAGLNKYTCSKCQKVLKVTVPVKDHELEKTYHDPTCAKGGYLEVTCNNCETEFPDETVEGDDPLPHDFTEVETPLEGQQLADICENGGTLVKTCKNEACNHHVETEAIAPGHSYALQQIKDADNNNKLMAIIRVCTRDENHVDPTPVFVATGYGYCVTDGVNQLGEEDVVAGKPATCVDDGFTEKKICPVCKETIQESTVIPAKGHTEPTEWTHTKAATCAEEGLDEWKCTECGEVLKTQTVSKLTTHNYVEALEDATCNTPERYVKRCTVCKQLDPDYTIIEVNPADPSLHEFSEEGVCIHCGTELPEGWKKCATCNKWTEFADDPTTATDATCTTPAQVTAKCKVCKTADPDGPHDVEGSVPDSYAHSFNAEDTCTICNKTAAELTNPENEAYLPLLAKCDTHGWVKGTEVPGTDSTCTVAGKEDALKCPKCAEENIIKGGEDKPLADHTWTDKYELDADNMPTCLEDGTKHKVCDVCGNTFGDPVTAEASDEYHDYQADTTPATCTTGEMVTEVCTICNNANPDFPGDEIGNPDPYAHKFDAETEICEYCHKTGTELSAEKGQEQLGKCTTHGWQKGLSVAEVPSTCAEAGTAAGYRCPVCAEAGTTTMIRGGEALPLAAHTESDNYETIKEPTCQETGVKKMICAVCDNPFGDEITMDIVDHNYVEVSSDPTCTHGERHGFYCTMCDQLRPGSGVEEGTELDPTNHEGEGVIEVEAVEGTCTVEGVTAGTKCKGCGEILTGCENTGIEMDNHKHIIDLPAVDPTCTEPGKTAGKKCDDCGEEIEKQTEIPALGHDFSESETCKVCGAKTAETTTNGATSVAEDGKKKVTFTSAVTVSDKDAEYVEMGILYITAADYAGNAKSDLTASVDAEGNVTVNTPVKAKRYTSSAYGDLTQFSGAIVNINLGATDANDNRALYARGYVVTKKNGVYTIHLSETVTSGSYAGGFTTN